MSTTASSWPPPLGLPVVDAGDGNPAASTRLTPRHDVRGRVLLAVAVVALLGGAGMAVAGLRSPGGDGAVVLDVTEERAPVPPTVAPVAAPQPDTAPIGVAPQRPVPSDTVATTSPQVLSPLADLLGPSYSAVPEEIDPRPRPIGVDIDGIDVAGYPIRPVGLAGNGELEVPDETEIGWYRYGATPGRPGATVLAAHVSWNRAVGPFGSLGNVEPGDRLEVTLDDGTARTYEVYERALYGKLELPRERIWRNTGPETIVLITCGGDFNPEIRRYRQNIVVYAAPIG